MGPKVAFYQDDDVPRGAETGRSGFAQLVVYGNMTDSLLEGNPGVFRLRLRAVDLAAANASGAGRIVVSRSARLVVGGDLFKLRRLV